MVGADHASQIASLSLELYTAAAAHALTAGIILADTKFEFGLDESTSPPSIVLADEVLTPDSSRFWPADQWEPGKQQLSYDKQIVRDWLQFESGWDRKSGEAPPRLSDEVIERTRSAYIGAYEQLTGRKFEG